MHQEYEDKNFDINFQEKLGMVLLDDREFCDQMFEVLDSSFFDQEYLQAFCNMIKDYKDGFKKHPSRDIMPAVIKESKDKFDDVVYMQIVEFYKKLYKGDINYDGVEFVKKTSLDFCKKQKLRDAMVKSVDKLRTCSFEEISKLLNDALKLGIDRDFGYDYLKDFEARFVQKARDPITTGWADIDKITKGGLGKSELGVVIAPTGAGKSMVLVHLGAQALKAGKTVVHYTLELQDTVVAQRYDSCLTNVSLNETYKKKDEIYEKVKSIPGRLLIKEYPTKSASTHTIRSHLEKLQQMGEDIGMVIVDYGDLLRPVNVQKEKRQELETIYEEMRGLAQEFGCPFWTASQTNRSGLSERLVTMESISEAFNKCFVADFILTLSRTMEDRNNNEGRFFIAKNRNGPDGIEFPVFMDTGYVKIAVMKKQTQNQTAPVAATKTITTKEQEENKESN